MQHRVTFIGEDDLPAGQDWALVRDDRTGHFDLLVNPAKLTPELMMECWATFVEMCQVPSRVPMQRRPMLRPVPEIGLAL